MSTEKTNILDTLGKTLGITASISFAASLLYDWGYYSALELSFADIPSSLTDHARSALIWVPAILGGFIPYFVFEVFTRRIERGMTEEEITSTSPEWIKKFRASPQKLIFYSSFIFAVAYVLMGDIFFNFAILAAVVLWISFAEWSQSHPRIEARRSLHVRLAIIILPAIGILLFSYGRSDAIKTYLALPNTTFSLSGRNLPIEATVLRYFDKGVLLKEKDGQIAFYQWPSITQIETTATYKPNLGILCSRFQIRCLNLESTTSTTVANPSSPASQVTPTNNLR